MVNLITRRIELDKTYYVYAWRIGEEIVYIGMGSGKRYLHGNSGISQNYHLNKVHFQDKNLLSVKFLKKGITKEEALAFEKDKIKLLRPKYNTVHKTQEVLEKMKGAMTFRKHFKKCVCGFTLEREIQNKLCEGLDEYLKFNGLSNVYYFYAYSHYKLAGQEKCMNFFSQIYNLTKVKRNSMCYMFVVSLQYAHKRLYPNKPMVVDCRSSPRIEDNLLKILDYQKSDEKLKVEYRDVIMQVQGKKSVINPTPPLA